MKKELTKRQKEVLNSIVKFQNNNERPPSLLDLQDMLNIGTPRGVSIHLDALEKKGYIKKDSTARSIRVLKEADEKILKDIIFLPLLGRIRAGEPSFAEELIEEYIPVPRQIVGNRRDAFLLKVYGDSMNNAHILEGDFVVVQPGITAFSGDIVVALTEDDATLKRLVKKDDGLYLMPESSNPKYKPRKITRDHIIQGKVISIMRNFA